MNSFNTPQPGANAALLLQRQQDVTDPMEAHVIQTLLTIVANQNNDTPTPLDSNQILSAFIAFSTPIVGRDYKKIVSDLYYDTYLAGQDQPDPKPPDQTLNIPTPEANLYQRVTRCIQNAHEHAGLFQAAVDLRYASELLHTTQHLLEMAKAQPRGLSSHMASAIGNAHIAYQVSSHPDQPPATREASTHAAAARSSLIVAHNLIQAFNRSMGTYTITVNGYAAPAALHGKYLYHNFIRDKVQEREGHFVVIDIKTADYETSFNEAQAHRALRKRRPDALCWVEKVGALNPYAGLTPLNPANPANTG